MARPFFVSLSFPVRVNEREGHALILSGRPTLGGADVLVTQFAWNTSGAWSPRGSTWFSLIELNYLKCH